MLSDAVAAAGEFAVRASVGNLRHGKAESFIFMAEPAPRQRLLRVAATLGDRDLLPADGRARPNVSDIAAASGVGASGRVAGHLVHVGKVSSVVTLGSELTAAVSAASERGLTPVVAVIDDQPVMVIVVGDRLKPTSAAAVARLRALGLTPVLLSGDRAETAQAVAAQAGIDQVIADVSPADKVAMVQQFQSRGAKVAMVGDGINDAAALAQADLGVAMGSGTDAAREAADITIVNSDLQSVGDAIELSRRTWRTIRQNLMWAFGYNVAAIPLAVSGLLSPMIAGAAMAFSSVLVVSNSLRLRGFRRS